MSRLCLRDSRRLAVLVHRYDLAGGATFFEPSFGFRELLEIPGEPSFLGTFPQRSFGSGAEVRRARKVVKLFRASHELRYLRTEAAIRSDKIVFVGPQFVTLSLRPFPATPFGIHGYLRPQTECAPLSKKAGCGRIITTKRVLVC
jgi:hypothetical protein